MKKLIILSFGILLIVSFAACGQKKIYYKEGSYEGSGQGHHGPMKVQITTDQYRIKEIKILEEYEMPELSEIVYDKIPKKIIKKNDADVDVVAGASYTSRGLIEAIQDGLDKAKVEQ